MGCLIVCYKVWCRSTVSHLMSTCIYISTCLIGLNIYHPPSGKTLKCNIKWHKLQKWQYHFWRLFLHDHLKAREMSQGCLSFFFTQMVAIEKDYYVYMIYLSKNNVFINPYISVYYVNKYICETLLIYIPLWWTTIWTTIHVFQHLKLFRYV